MRVIRDLTQQLNEYCSNGTTLVSEPIAQIRQQSKYDEKLERCCQRLEQLTSKVDRLINLEQTGNFYRTIIKMILFFYSGVLSRPNRPSPSTAANDASTTNEPQVTLTDAHYDRLEAILVEKIQAYVQSGK